MQPSEDYIKRAVSIARAYGATRVILFGSAVDAPETACDLDLAVEGVRAWDFFGLAAELQSEIPIRVDLIPLDQVEDNHFTQAIKKRGRVVFQEEAYGGL